MAQQVVDHLASRRAAKRLPDFGTPFADKTTV
jgi:hypothetical protein